MLATPTLTRDLGQIITIGSSGHLQCDCIDRRVRFGGDSARFDFEQGDMLGNLGTGANTATIVDAIAIVKNSLKIR